METEGKQLHNPNKSRDLHHFIRQRNLVSIVQIKNYCPCFHVLFFAPEDMVEIGLASLYSYFSGYIYILFCFFCAIYLECWLHPHHYFLHLYCPQCIIVRYNCLGTTSIFLGREKLFWLWGSSCGGDEMKKILLHKVIASECRYAQR